MKLCPLCSGSSGNATYIEAGNARLLIDAGLSCKRITELLERVGVDPRTLSAILITHEHIDHVRGVNILSKKYDIPVYANADTWSVLKAPLRDVAAKNVCVFESDRDFYLAGARILPFSVPHDAVHCVGFTVSAQGHKVGVCTDLGHVDARILSILSGCDLLLFEANHDVDMLMAGSYPYLLKKRILSGNGHMNNDDCGRALVKLHETGVKNVILGHLSQENNYPALAMIAVRSVLEEAGIANDMQIAVAAREEPTGVFEIL
ncbi:MAG: MBL fold metallo-hydrolase [Clostridia bacterium]|jgi:phosphoribosyl 1,2-cyclic phosphodiesterase|nr:MBL fold metallo-hydrolase [Clostridia bacterium]MDO4835819.1 MBL fold metallo-hydrolase [Clostridia bacterium]